MLDNETETTYVHITPRGALAFRVMDDIDNLLVEQRQALCDLLLSARQSLLDHETFDAGVHLVDAMSLLGLVSHAKEGI